ncbi:RNA polymerase sigma factor [Tautonia plasticadhaerens]|uniref:ECF RNA polymerase sigma factor SigE n=1 Tax=Tautonia plasticadhaerens TaxID=2527974 RepID=A0A518HDZ3_9BACT|nr:RNA polymerase sigma factor [Tautonia plasticadhaerens]QDV38926.1 ECF RNA polymerase sigma factor SigE [Tautonia plasticadhaerens]
MARGQSGVARPLRVLFEVGAVGGLEDAHLLDRFLEADGPGAEHAFSALVDRHGPMVLATCLAQLRDRHEAEDAFQATFLVLARRAGSIGRRRSVAAWLHGVACRVSRKARLSAARRRVRERRVADAVPASACDRPPDDLAPVLHEELGRLPESYRAPVVLCYLEGLTHEQAAALLGWPVGTVKGRLARARDLLRTRLARRGLAPAAVGALAATIAARRSIAAVPRSLIDPTTRLAVEFAAGSSGLAGSAAARVVSLSQGVLTSMRWNAIVKTMLVAIPAVALTVGIGAVSARQGDDPAPIPAAVEPPRAAEAPSVAPPALDPGPIVNGSALPPAEVSGVIQFIWEPESFSAYTIPEGFDLEQILEAVPGIDQEVDQILAGAIEATEAELRAMQEQRTQVATALAKYHHAFSTLRRRRDALNAMIADATLTPPDGEIDGALMRDLQSAEQVMLAEHEDFVEQLGGTIRGLEVRARTLDLAIGRLSAMKDALSGPKVPAVPSTGSLTPSLNIEPPPLDPAARRTSVDLSATDPRDRRIDALERKLDAVLEALRASDR